MGSRWFEMNWISGLWDRRRGSDTADIILLAIRQVMLRTLESPKRKCYSHSLQECSCRFLPTPLPSMVCARTHHVAPARMEKNQVQLCLPWKKQISWAGEEGICSPLLACSWSFSRHHFSISFQGNNSGSTHRCQSCSMWPAGHGGLQKCSAYACSQVRTIQSSLV